MTKELLAGGILFLFFVGFAAFFVVPGFILRMRLRRISDALRNAHADNLAAIERSFQPDITLRHLWKEFRDTLHPQREERDGQLTIVAFRATAPAESFFNAQNVVDGRLRTEFFKHLPGILTGIGIIGTFAGLIAGLQNFEVPDDPARVRASLEMLLHGVNLAFIISASAIGLAMAVTLVEKLLLTSLYRQIDQIAQHLDSLFAMGAGEEYLARLVSASEDSAAQAKILKDALVGDLKLMLQEMTERQITAQHESTVALAQNIRDGITSGLEEPLTRISNVVERTSGDQSDIASELLKDVMSSFSENLNKLLGGQISGIQELMQKSSSEMQQVASALNSLVGRMEESSRRSGDEMASRMAAAIENMERRQAAISQQSLRALESMREITASSQTEILTKLQVSMTGLTQQIGTLVGSLQSETKNVLDEQREREKSHAESVRQITREISESTVHAVNATRESIDQMKTMVTDSGDAMATRMAAAIENMERRQAAINAQSQKSLEAMREVTTKSQSEILDKIQLSISGLAQQSSALVGSLQTEAQGARDEQRKREMAHAEGTRAMVENMSESAGRAMDSVRDCIEQMRTTIAVLERTTTTAIDKMNSGAERLESGSVAFAEAGSRVTQAIELTGTVARKLTDLSSTLTTSSSALRDALADYRENQQATTEMTAELRGIVEAAGREAGLTREALDSIEAAARHLGEARLRANDYLESVSGVLTESHKTFAEGLISVLNRANQDFFQKLSTAVGLLGDAVQELEVTLATATPKR